MNPILLLTELLRRHTVFNRLLTTSVPGLQLLHCSFPSQPLYAAQGPCLTLLVQGAKSLRFGQVELRYACGQYLLTSIDLPVTSRILEASPERPMLGLAMTIEPDALAQVTRRASARVRAGGQSAVAVHDADPELLQAVLRLVALLNTPEHAAGLGPIYQQEILYRLLVGPSGARLLQLACSDSPSNRIAQVMARLRVTYALPLRVENLAREVGMSVSTFHHHFKEVSRLTPIQFQKALRLHEARRLMLVERCDVGEASYQVGYQSPSQFTKDYRRYFGATPRDDVRGLRLAGGLNWTGDTYLPLESGSHPTSWDR